MYSFWHLEGGWNNRQYKKGVFTTYSSKRIFVFCPFINRHHECTSFCLENGTCTFLDSKGIIFWHANNTDRCYSSNISTILSTTGALWIRFTSSFMKYYDYSWPLQILVFLNLDSFWNLIKQYWKMLQLLESNFSPC